MDYYPMGENKRKTYVALKIKILILMNMLK